MIITEKVRNKILLHLPKDYQKQGEEETGFSRSMIYKVLHEEQENDTIALWLISKAKVEKELKEQTAHKLSKIAEQL
jgi:hypothetical protein